MVQLENIGKDFLVGFFAVMALSDFVLKKFKNVDVLAYGDHRTARIE